MSLTSFVAVAHICKAASYPQLNHDQVVKLTFTSMQLNSASSSIAGSLRTPGVSPRCKTAQNDFRGSKDKWKASRTIEGGKQKLHLVFLKLFPDDEGNHSNTKKFSGRIVEGCRRTSFSIPKWHLMLSSAASTGQRVPSSSSIVKRMLRNVSWITLPKTKQSAVEPTICWWFYLVVYFGFSLNTSG